MLNLFNKKERKSANYPVFNLEITRDKTTSHLQKYDNTSQRIGEFMVLTSGELERGVDHNLHTYEVKLGYCEDHIHFPKGGTVDIINRNSKSFLVAEFRTPRLTLDGLYSSVKSWELKKPEILIKHIKRFNPDFQFNSIATHEDTRVKLLENVYKRHVSNQ